MVMNLVSYWFSDKIVLRMYNAKEVTEAGSAGAVQRHPRSGIKMNMPMPKVYVIPSEALNAFATGRNPNHAAVAATEGHSPALSREELTGVMAHELSHVRNRDILIGTIAAAIAGAISMLANMAQWAMIFGGFGGRRDDDRGGGIGAIAMIILAPIAALLIQMAISRSREYEADASGARLCGNPRSLASALAEASDGFAARPDGCESGDRSHVHRESASRRRHQKLFSTHPPMEERIARLESMIL